MYLKSSMFSWATLPNVAKMSKELLHFPSIILGILGYPQLYIWILKEVFNFKRCLSSQVTLL